MKHTPSVESGADFHTVKRVQFGILNPKEIVRIPFTYSYPNLFFSKLFLWSRFIMTKPMMIMDSLDQVVSTT